MYYVVDLALRNPHQDHAPKREGKIHNMDFGITGVDLALEKTLPSAYPKNPHGFYKKMNKNFIFYENYRMLLLRAI